MDKDIAILLTDLFDELINNIDDYFVMVEGASIESKVLAAEDSLRLHKKCLTQLKRLKDV